VPARRVTGLAPEQPNQSLRQAQIFDGSLALPGGIVKPHGGFQFPVKPRKVARFSAGSKIARIGMQNPEITGLVIVPEPDFKTS
jgi:hypothetical protein